MLEIRDLSVFIQTDNSEKEVVSHVNFTVP